MDYVLLHPETHAAYLQERFLRTRAHFDRFFQTAGLSADQQEQLMQHLQTTASAELDLMAALRAEGWSVGNLPKDPAARAQFHALMAEGKKRKASQAADAMRRLLGDSVFQQFQEYAGTIPERNVAAALVGQL